MKVSCKSFDEQKYPKVLIDKQEAVGDRDSGRGYMFDSGCNLSGVRKIHVCLGTSTNHINQIKYYQTIERIFLEFETTMHSDKHLTPFYDVGGAFSGSGIRRILKVDKNDSIARIDVYRHGYTPCGIQFHLNSGAVSELYGSTGNSGATSFEGNHPGSKLVGVHGLYSKSIVKVGFTFAGPTPVEEMEEEDEEETEASTGGSRPLNGDERVLSYPVEMGITEQMDVPGDDEDEEYSFIAE